MDNIGKLLDGRWEIIAYKQGSYTLKNIYNENILYVHEESVNLILKGELTVSRIIALRIKRKNMKNKE